MTHIYVNITSRESWVSLMFEGFPFHRCDIGLIITTYKKDWFSLPLLGEFFILPQIKSIGIQTSLQMYNVLELGIEHKKNTKNKKIKKRHLHRTSCAVNLFFGSLTSILRTKSFAPSDILGHGSDMKSRSPRRTSSNISSSVSALKEIAFMCKFFWSKHLCNITNNQGL